MTEVQILGVGLTAQSFEAAVESLLDRAQGTTPSRVHFVNVHNLIEARRKPDLKDVFESAWMRCTDGMPLAWIERRRGVPACAPSSANHHVGERRNIGLESNQKAHQSRERRSGITQNAG